MSGVTNQQILEQSLQFANENYELRAELKQMREVLADYSLRSAGPCQAGLMERCKCLKCWDDRREKALCSTKEVTA